MNTSTCAHIYITQWASPKHVLQHILEIENSLKQQQLTQLLHLPILTTAIIESKEVLDERRNVKAKLFLVMTALYFLLSLGPAV